MHLEVGTVRLTRPPNHQSMMMSTTMPIPLARQQTTGQACHHQTWMSPPTRPYNHTCVVDLSRLSDVQLVGSRTFLLNNEVPTSKRMLYVIQELESFIKQRHEPQELWQLQVFTTPREVCMNWYYSSDASSVWHLCIKVLLLLRLGRGGIDLYINDSAFCPPAIITTTTRQSLLPHSPLPMSIKCLDVSLKSSYISDREHDDT